MKPSSFRVSVLLLFAFFLTAAPTPAQMHQGGHILGLVADDSGRPIAGARVAASYGRPDMPPMPPRLRVGCDPDRPGWPL